MKIMTHLFPKISLALALILLPVFIWLGWSYFTTTPTLTTLTRPFAQAGERVTTDLSAVPAVAFTENTETQSYDVTAKKEGLDIQFANQEETLREAGAKEQESPLTLSFPKDYSQPIQIKLDERRVISITDLSAEGQSGYTSNTVTLGGESAAPTVQRETLPQSEENWFAQILKRTSSTGRSSHLEVQPLSTEKNYLRYQSQDQRKELLYAFQQDGATGEKKLKHWTLYRQGNGLEKETYQFTNAKLKLNEQGEAEVFYFGEQEMQNEQAAAEVSPDLLARAQRTLAKEMGEELEQNILAGKQTPDLIIPAPYYVNSQGEEKALQWQIEPLGGSTSKYTLSVSFGVGVSEYPLALDPTLSFTAPGMSNTASVITGQTTSNRFGVSLATGDLNNDGKTDLIVVAYGYSSNTGRAYIFYNDGSIPTTAATADVIITGETTNNYFGISLATGDLNADGKTDLIIGASGYSSNTGRAYIFYNDGSIPTTAGTADVIITGVTTNNFFGDSLTTGDLNADGKTDLIVGAYGYSSNTGRAYIFYNDGSIPTTAATADVIITGETTSSGFGSNFTTGDLNADGKTDLVVGAKNYSSNTGRAYIFYNDGSIPTTAATADVIITGETTSNLFSNFFTTGDLNSDGKTDLIVGAYYYSSSTGRVYIFYNDGSIPTTAATADVTITGETTSNNFGFSLATGDLNADGKTDLIIGADGYSSSTGRAYIFYNDGSIPTTAATADVIITGQTTLNSFGISLTSGDWNSDGRTDLAVGAGGYSTSTGRAYIFYSQNGQVNTNQNLTGETTSNSFGVSLTSGDFNADGKTDLAVGAEAYSSYTGRAYLFYNDGSIPTTAATADVTITGEATSNSFGTSLTSGDFNSDGRTDLAVGAPSYSTNTGRAYLFYNDGSIPTTAATADVIITGEAGDRFGWTLTTGDLNADGTIDLVVAARDYSSSTGRACIFYNDGSIPTTAATADVIITGGATLNLFSTALTTGDLNADGTTDLVVGAYNYSSSTGRAYIFYNDGSIPTTAATADVIITGASNTDFGFSLTVGDLNSDGTADLIVGANQYSSNTGRAYLFYNDGSIPTTAATADVIITGETTSNSFGNSLTTGDLNADGKTDLAVGAYQYSSSTGRAYIFYNDGSIPTTAATADVTITGETTSNNFSTSLTTGDLNADGKTDLAVGAYGYSSSTGRVYIYETRDNFAWQIQEQSAVSDPLRVNPDFSGQELKITGGAAGDSFGYSLTTGDLNADGKTDLVVGAYNYSSSTGRAYIFYNDGSLTTSANSADVVITGEATSNYFGYSIAVGDLNADGKTDLAVGAYGYSTDTGRAYIFYNDGSISTTAATADVTITSETTSNYFGYSLTTGDLNSDGKTDLAVGAYAYSISDTGRVYIFYNDGSIPTTAATADVTITGEAGSAFGYTITVGDMNSDSRTDLVVGGKRYSSFTGRVYIFYNDGSIPTTSATADVTISGESNSQFGISLATGDLNTDGKTDLIVGADYYSANFTGRAYIFYNDGSIPTTAATADVTITGETTSNSFGGSLATGDFNTDGKTDLAVGASGYSSSTGRAYIFYNGSIITENASGADLILTGEATSNNFGWSLAVGDLNSDGKTDLVVGANTYASSKGRVYIYTFNDGRITGETTSNSFGIFLATGDLNADGKTDLIVGASGYSSSTGRAYIFYNDGSIPTTAATADVIITGEAGNFGWSLTTGDLNSDGKTDLAVGARGYSTNTGRAYIFYNDGSIPTTAGTADVIITGEAGNFGWSLTTGDLNSDGKTDLAVGARGYSTNTGRAYIFYNDGSIPTTAATADVTITGEATSNFFGTSLATGDLNSDGKTDLAVGAYGYSSSTGRAYIFYNDGSIPTTAATADVIITGPAGGSTFGVALTVGDLNADGRVDLVVGSDDYNTSLGQAYIFYNDGSLPTTAGTADVTITGQGNYDFFGTALATGDLNADGKTDLIVGEKGYSNNAGYVYIFYNDGSFPTTAATADVTLRGETTNNYFGGSLATGDLNADGTTDLAVGADLYLSSTGRAYIFITEAARATLENTSQATLKGAQKFKGTLKFR